MKLCQCGCGLEVAKPGNKYIYGHSNNGRFYSEETRKKIGEGNSKRVWSKESREKSSQSHKGRIPSKEARKKMSESGRGRIWSEKSKEKLSESKRGHIVSEETKRKISKTKKGHTVSKKTRQKLSITGKDRICLEETRKKLSIANKGQIPSYRVGRGKKSYHNSPYQDKICFRSSYEKAYAKYLDSGRKDWLYEPCTFDLGNTTYLPDFYLIKDKKFVEIKGYMKESAQKKINLFRGIYPEEKLEVLFKEDLIEMGVI
jgi:hypothetical protein